MTKQQNQSPAKETKPKPQPKKKMYWGERTFHIKGHGMTQVGEEVTESMRKCWAKASPLDIDNYLTDKPPVVEAEEVE